MPQKIKQTVNIRSISLKHKQLRQYFSHTCTEYEYEVRWLVGNMMDWHYNQETKVRTFCECNGRNLAEFKDSVFINGGSLFWGLYTSQQTVKKLTREKQAVIRVVATSCDGMSQCLIGDFNGHQTGNKSFSALQAILVFEMSNRHKWMNQATNSRENALIFKASGNLSAYSQLLSKLMPSQSKDKKMTHSIFTRKILA